MCEVEEDIGSAEEQPISNRLQDIPKWEQFILLLFSFRVSSDGLKNLFFVRKIRVFYMSAAPNPIF
ncbi:hypothetical protein D0T49_10050 [Paludibacter sp. 221]|nr:hypothetical protein [Paludibacter sp. 221]